MKNITLFAFLIFAFAFSVTAQNADIPSEYSTKIINARLAFEAKCQAAKLKKSRAESAAKEAARLQEDAELELLALQTTKTELVGMQFQADFRLSEITKAEIDYQTELKIAELNKQRALQKAEQAAKFNLKYNVPVVTKTDCYGSN